MARKRMFSKRLTESARFLQMPLSTQALYFHLGLNADDDGVVEAYNVMQVIGCAQDDLRVLVSKGYVKVLNEDLVTYITDWRENNTLRADRKTDSIYHDLLISMFPDVELLEKKQRSDVAPKIIDATISSVCIEDKHNGQSMDGIGENRIDKNSLDKSSLGERCALEKKIFETYAVICKSLPKVQKRTTKRVDAIGEILKNHSFEEIVNVFEIAEKSEFLRGSKGFKATFDWIMVEDNFIKVLEGNYTDEIASNSGAKKNQFNNFSQRDTDLSDIEQKMLSRGGAG